MKILIIDDDKQACEYLIRYFAKGKCDVRAVNSGKEGYETVKSYKPDITLLDVRMEDMDGLTLLKKIKSLNKNNTIIMITVASDDETRKQAQELGADGFIRKPIKMGELTTMVAVQMGKKMEKGWKDAES